MKKNVITVKTVLYRDMAQERYFQFSFLLEYQTNKNRSNSFQLWYGFYISSNFAVNSHDECISLRAYNYVIFSTRQRLQRNPYFAYRYRGKSATYPVIRTLSLRQVKSNKRISYLNAGAHPALVTFTCNFVDTSILTPNSVSIVDRSRGSLCAREYVWPNENLYDFNFYFQH